jgi:ADP-heptose:LPS heptosyltransferase
MPSSDFRHLLILKPTALGDIAQALLAVPKIKERHPDWKLSWVVDEAYLPLVRCSPAIDQAIAFPRARWRRGGCWREMLDWAAGLRAQKADLVLDLQGLARSALMGLASGAPRRIGFASAREGSRFTYHELVADTQAHAIDRYLGAVEHVAGSPGDPTPAHLPPPAQPLPGGLATGNYTVVHPYSNWESKLWNWGNYDPLCQRLSQERIVLVGQGPSFPVTAPNVLDLRGKTGLAELLAVLGQAGTVISTDSGPLHTAAAFNRPLIALFGATDPRKTGPRSQKQVVLQGTRIHGGRDTYRSETGGRALAGISVEAVARAWESLNT